MTRPYRLMFMWYIVLPQSYMHVYISAEIFNVIGIYVYLYMDVAQNSGIHEFGATTAQVSAQYACACVYALCTHSYTCMHKHINHDPCSH